MKPFYIAALLALGPVACVDSTPALQVLTVAPPDTDCVIPDDVGLLRGSVNLSLTDSYLLGLNVVSNLQGSEVLVGGNPVSDPNSLNVYLTEVEFSYATEPRINVESETVAIYGSFPSADDGQLLINLLTTKAAETLKAQIAADASVEMVVTIQLHGKTTSGSEVDSNEVKYPLTVTNEAFACPDNQVPVVPADIACNLIGMNGVVPACAAPPTTPTP
ncbi:hypothetical protein LY474_06095 [Myxococcus stipitatus]|uniref:hypothetical protein n=1 Tax=Myxococcus stipitatus TaxID=83455 RepID=UPI001F41083B|nr:hypothetical protein [Myxococcus stipitatus]MCE9667381.1 hypothetical protein [Myxococcus stipitatus]